MLKLLVVLCYLYYSISKVYSAPLYSEKDLFKNITELDSNSVLLEESKVNIINAVETDLTTPRPPAIVLLFQGVCDEDQRRPRFYTENFVFENDGKSQVHASMTIQMSGSPNITCVEIVSRSNDKARPTITKGGVGNTYVNVAVMTEYGKGFDFSVNLYGSFFSDNEK